MKKWTLRALLAVALLATSVTVSQFIDPPKTPGQGVSEAASHVSNQVDDTQEAFTRIKDLIPDNSHLEATASGKHLTEPTTASTSPATGLNAAQTQPAYGDNAPSPTHNTAATDSDMPGDSRADPNAINELPPTLTFNQKARATQRDQVLTEHQEAMDLIVANWAPQYKSAKREHDELMDRIAQTRFLWPEYQETQAALIGQQRNPALREMMRNSLVDDIQTYKQWNQKALEVERRSIDALEKIEDMNTFIIFYKNQADFKAITEYNHLEVPQQIGLLLNSLDTFEHQTAGLATAMTSS